MKITAEVILETLRAGGEWQLFSGDPTASYAFPRRFDGSAAGHVQILPPDAAGGALLDAPSSLLVLTAPARLPAAPGCAVLVPSAPRAEAEVWDRLTALYDRMERWSDALSACGGELSGIQRMLECSAAEMGGSFVLIDESYHIPAYTGSGVVNAFSFVDEDGARASDRIISVLAEDPQMATVRSVRGVNLYESNLAAGGSKPALFRNMFREGERSYFNRLLYFRMDGVYSRTDAFMLEQLAQRVEQITAHLSTFAIPIDSLLPLKQLLSRAGQPGFRADGSVLSPLKWSLHDDYRFYVFASLYSGRDAGITDYILRRLERLIPASCGVANEARILLLQNVTRSAAPLPDLRPLLTDFLRENIYKVGVSEAFGSFDLLRGALLQAEAALTLGEERDPMLWYYPFSAYLSDYLVRNAPGDIPAVMLIHPALEQLRQHDRLNGTQYVQTLRVLIEDNCNITHAAQHLFVHRSSLQDRIERIQTLTGLELSDARTRALLWFSFQLLGQKQPPRASERP